MTRAYREETQFHDSFPATAQEVVPQLEQALIYHTILIGVLAQLVCEKRYEPSCSEKVRCDTLIAKMICEFWVHDAQ